MAGTSFASLLSDSGVSIEEISRLVGHKSPVITELVYRKQLRPVVQSGAVVMDHILGSVSHADSHSTSRKPDPLITGPGADLG